MNERTNWKTNEQWMNKSMKKERNQCKTAHSPMRYLNSRSLVYETSTLVLKIDKTKKKQRNVTNKKEQQRETT